MMAGPWKCEIADGQPTMTRRAYRGRRCVAVVRLEGVQVRAWVSGADPDTTRTAWGDWSLAEAAEWADRQASEMGWELEG